MYVFLATVAQLLESRESEKTMELWRVLRPHEREDTVVASERLELDHLPQYLPHVNVERNELILAEKKVKKDMVF